MAAQPAAKTKQKSGGTGRLDDLLASQIEETREMERQSAASGLRSPVALASAARVPSTAYPVSGHAPNWTCQFLF